MKKEWSRVLTAATVLMMLFSCGSNEPEKELKNDPAAIEFDEHQKEYHERLEDANKWLNYFDREGNYYGTIEEGEEYSRKITYFKKWDSIWNIKFHKKYPNFNPEEYLKKKLDN